MDPYWSGATSITFLESKHPLVKLKKPKLWLTPARRDKAQPGFELGCSTQHLVGGGGGLYTLCAILTDFGTNLIFAETEV